MSIDFNSEFGQKALSQLHHDHVSGLQPPRSKSGTPQPNVVWFLYQDGDIIVYTKPAYQRLENIAKNPKVSLNFNTPEDGEAMTVFTGTAVIDPATKSVIDNPEYIEKYERWMDHIGTTPQAMSDDYSVPIRIKLEKLRGW